MTVNDFKRFKKAVMISPESKDFRNLASGDFFDF